jgi:hypothetical protein
LSEALIVRGVSLGQAYEALKGAMVRSAERTEGADASDSRISLVTGLHRKDVKRLREAMPQPKRTAIGAVAQVLAHWRGEPDLAGPDGGRPLTRAEFDALVRSARIDMAPGTVLAALQDHGAVTTDDAGLLVPLTTAALPRAGSDEMVAAFGATLAPHLDAAVHNLTATEGTRHYDRALRYSHLSPESVAELDAAARKAAQEMLVALDRKAHELQKRDRDLPGATGRFVLGAFVRPDPPEDHE